MLVLRSWQKWNAGVLGKIRRTRKDRGISPDAPYSMSQITLATAFDFHFTTFAALVGHCSEGYFLRVLQYVGSHGALTGSVEVARESFGPVVLTRPWDIVGSKRGCQIYDALLSSGIAKPWNASPPVTPQATPQETPPTAPHATPPVEGSSGRVVSGLPPSPPPEGGTASPSNGHVRPREARKLAEQDRIEKARSPENLQRVARTLPDGVALHGGYVPGNGTPKDASDPSAGARRVLDELSKPPTKPIIGPPPEPKPAPPKASDPERLAKLKAETMAKIAEMEADKEAR